MVIWSNGSLTEEPERVDPRELCLGAFTTAGCDRGRPLLWERHRARLAATLSELDPGLGVVLPARDEMSNLLSAGGLSGPARLRLVATRAGAAWNLEASASAEPDAGSGRPPLALHVVEWVAPPPLAGHKTLARLAWDAAAGAARAEGADDAVLADSSGRVLETSVANLWARFEDRVTTPRAPQSCLPGIMRGWLVDNLHRAGLQVEEADLHLQTLLEADEVWASNAVAGVCRVARVGDASWSTWQAFAKLQTIGVPAPGWPAAPDTR